MTQTKVIEVTAPNNVDILIRIRPETAVPGYTYPMLVPGDFGIDVSRHQGVIDWSRVITHPAGIKYVVMRSSMGQRGSGFTGRDDQFSRNWAETRKLPVLRGVYHYYVNGVDPLAQADNFYSCLMENGGELGDLPLVVDVELRTGEIVQDKAKNTSNLKILLEELARLCNGRQAMIYTGQGAWDACTTKPAWASEYLLWVANPSLTKVSPSMPVGWSEWVFWQYSWTGQVPGIGGNVDLNRFKGWGKG